MKHTKVFNSYGQVVEVQYEILKSIAYWMTIQYDTAGRTTTCDIRVGVDSNVTRYTYEYDADSQLQSASVNERPQWRYSYDLNGNINLLSHGTSARYSRSIIYSTASESMCYNLIVVFPALLSGWELLKSCIDVPLG